MITECRTNCKMYKVKKKVETSLRQGTRDFSGPVDVSGGKDGRKRPEFVESANVSGRRARDCFGVGACSQNGAVKFTRKGADNFGTGWRPRLGRSMIANGL